MNDLVKLISCYDTVGLKDMGQLQLMNRIDTKFLLSHNAIIDCLSAHIEDYAVVEINGKAILPYDTTYYDTEGLSMYYEHHNGKNRRYKIRYREYLESGDKFLEIKLKEKNRTNKRRIPVNQFEEVLLGSQQEFINDNSPYYAEDLVPTLSTIFDRITLVSKINCERITIDFNLRFINETKEKLIDNCVIVEVKRNREEVFSKFSRTIKSKGFLSTSISKYCLGTIALNNDVKYNRFKPRLREVSKLMIKESFEVLQVG